MSAALKIPAEPTPRQVLREKIAARDAIVRKMSEATKARSESEKAVQRAQADLDALAEREAADWAGWAEHRGDHPVDSRPRRAELTAIHASAGRAADAVAAAWAEAERVAMRDLPGCQAAVLGAVRDILLAEAVRLGDEYASAVEHAERTEAALQGIKNAFAGNFGAGVAQMTLCLQGNRTADGAMRRRAGLRHESAAIRERWRGLAERLLIDPDAEEGLQ